MSGNASGETTEVYSAANIKSKRERQGQTRTLTTQARTHDTQTHFPPCLQVNTRLLFQGATRENVRAFLAAKQVMAARTPRVSAHGEAGTKGGGGGGGGEGGCGG